jgi:hypothetical protein
LEGSLRVATGDQDRRQQRRQDHGNNCDSAENKENGPVDRDRISAGNGSLWKLANGKDGKLSQNQAGCAAQNAENDTFRQNLTDNPPAPGAERDANRELLLARETACDEQV